MARFELTRSININAVRFAEAMHKAGRRLHLPHYGDEGDRAAIHVGGSSGAVRGTRGSAASRARLSHLYHLNDGSCISMSGARPLLGAACVAVGCGDRRVQC